jgi:hypothetical protein
MAESRWAAIAAALALASCIEARPLELPADNPASPKATAGLIAAPVALGEYRTPADFAARAADPGAASSSHAGHAHGARR